MMQGTGNNEQANKKILSIRVTPNGLSFSVISPSKSYAERYIAYSSTEKTFAGAVKNVVEAQDEVSRPFSGVQVFLDTTRTVFVPEAALKLNDADYYLAEAGIRLSADRKTVVSPLVKDVCAVMSYDAGVLDYFSGRFGDNVNFFSPLQENLEMIHSLRPSGASFIVNITERNIYITGFAPGGGLLMAEVYPYSNDADIIYYMHKVVSEGKVDARAVIYVSGNGGQKHIKLINKYFKGAVCV